MIVLVLKIHGPRAPTVPAGMPALRVRYVFLTILID